MTAKQKPRTEKLIKVKYRVDKRSHRWLKILTYEIDSPSNDVLRQLKKEGVVIRL